MRTEEPGEYLSTDQGPDHTGQGETTMVSIVEGDRKRNIIDSGLIIAVVGLIFYSGITISDVYKMQEYVDKHSSAEYQHPQTKVQLVVLESSLDHLTKRVDRIEAKFESSRVDRAETDIDDREVPR